MVRRAVAGAAVGALAASLTPGATAAEAAAPAPSKQDTTQQSDARARASFTVRLRVANQKPKRVRTARTWPGGVLHDRRVDRDRNDLVVVRRDGREVHKKNKRLQPGDGISLVVVDARTRAHRATIDRPVKTRKVDSLKPGKRKVVKKGRPGVRKVWVTRTRHNDRVVHVSRTKKVVRKPVARRVLIGRDAYSVPGADHLNWRGLANCESSGNPRAVNPAGYYGLYQFDTGTWRGVGGHGLPSHASAGEQTYRAKLLYKKRGRSPWPNCGRFL